MKLKAVTFDTLRGSLASRVAGAYRALAVLYASIRKTVNTNEDLSASKLRSAMYF